MATSSQYRVKRRTMRALTRPMAASRRSRVGLRAALATVAAFGVGMVAAPSAWADADMSLGGVPE